ncbi:MAG TPA: phosphatidate cytidylyltransferase [Egibacteraceae bacterium]|nr:phosphatidate cytidylyltransferase [Egibacteraceae bacterium]
MALAVAFIGSLVLSPWLLLAFIGVLLLIALFELDRAFREHGLRPGTPVAVGAGFVMFFGSYPDGASAQTLGLVLLLFGAMAWALLDRGRTRMAASLGATMLMAVWVPFLASFIGLLLARPDGRWYVFLAVLFAVFNDIGAYAVGMRFGRHKMAPTVSPAKSWEGLAGGILAATVVALVVAVPLVPDLRAVHAVVLAVGASVAGTLGDLAESMVKRDLGVKDLGSVLPGHGGIMDRADAIIFALPMTYLLLDALGVG